MGRRPNMPASMPLALVLVLVIKVVEGGFGGGDVGGRDDLEVPKEYSFPTEHLRGPDPSSGKPYAVLLGGGSYSPMTQMHVKLTEEAYNTLRKDFDVGGMVVQLVNNYYEKASVKEHPYYERYPIAKLQIQGIPWLAIDTWGYFYGEEHHIQPPTERDLQHTKEEIDKLYPGSNAQIIMVGGQDLIEGMVNPDWWAPADILSMTTGRFGVAVMPRIEDKNTQTYEQAEQALKDLIKTHMKRDVDPAVAQRCQDLAGAGADWAAQCSADAACLLVDKRGGDGMVVKGEKDCVADSGTFGPNIYLIRAKIDDELSEISSSKFRPLLKTATNAELLKFAPLRVINLIRSKGWYGAPPTDPGAKSLRGAVEGPVDTGSGA